MDTHLWSHSTHTHTHPSSDCLTLFIDTVSSYKFPTWALASAHRHPPLFVWPQTGWKSVEKAALLCAAAAPARAGPTSCLSPAGLRGFREQAEPLSLSPEIKAGVNKAQRRCQRFCLGSSPSQAFQTSLGARSCASDQDEGCFFKAPG